VMWPLLLVPLGWAVPTQKSSKESREETLRLFLILSAELVVYLAIRQAVVGGFAGDLQHPLWRGTTFGTRAITMLAAIPVWSRLLLWPAHLQADYAPQELMLAHGLGPDQWLGLFLLVALAGLFVVSWRRMPVAAAGLAWTVLAVAPVANLVTPTGIVLAERTLFLPSFGLVLAVGAMAAALEARVPGTSRWARPVIGALALVLCLLGVARSAVRLPVWRDNTTLFGTTVVDAPRSYWAWRNWAGDLVLTDHPAEARAAYQHSLALFDRDPTVYDDLASFERRSGRCDLAIAHFRASLAIDSTRYMTTSRLIGCLTLVGDYDAARALARGAMAAGRKEFGSLLQLVDSVAAAQPR
ncbi:MAG TPA: tetratricopeptide repeat protein, partial [Gemmatimonadales bacterium]|nr:tetratricopeptide repeat protein [Gemmatimonadales bacterium]